MDYDVCFCISAPKGSELDETGSVKSQRDSIKLRQRQHAVPLGRNRVPKYHPMADSTRRYFDSCGS